MLLSIAVGAAAMSGAHATNFKLSLEHSVTSFWGDYIAAESMSLQGSLYTVLHRFALCSLPAVCAEVLPQPAKLSVILIQHLPDFFTFPLEKFMFCLLLSHVTASLQIKATCKIPQHKCLCRLQILIQASQPLQNGAQAISIGMGRRMAHVAARHQR